MSASNPALLTNTIVSGIVWACQRKEMWCIHVTGVCSKHHLAQVREVSVTGHKGTHPRARVRQHQRLIRWVHSQPAVDGVACSPQSLHHTNQSYIERPDTRCAREMICVASQLKRRNSIRSDRPFGVVPCCRLVCSGMLARDFGKQPWRKL